MPRKGDRRVINDLPPDGAIERFRIRLPHGIELSCRACGARGRPVLIFLHGFPEAAFVWDALLAHFADPAHGGYRCVAPNLRGYEASSQPLDVGAYRAKHLAQDISALIDAQAGEQPLAALIAHDWGGAVAWTVANLIPQRLDRLVIINSPHPGTFLRELRGNPRQQQASAYMNFLIRPDAESLLAADDFRRLWEFFTGMGAGPDRGEPGRPVGAGWLDEDLRTRYREVWRQGLTGGLNYYRASPLRPAREGDPAASAVELPMSMLTIQVPTRVVWAQGDIALLPELVDGLDAYVPRLTLVPVERATHWIVHERPTFIAQQIAEHLALPTQ
jgi:pimeloyl-ACP methyl ester carboxylesterase